MASEDGAQGRKLDTEDNDKSQGSEVKGQRRCIKKMVTKLNIILSYAQAVIVH